MSLLEGFTKIAENVMKSLTIKGKDWKFECSDTLVAFLGAGILAVIGEAVYLHGDKFEKWIEAYKKEKNTDIVDMNEFKKWFKIKTWELKIVKK